MVRDLKEQHNVLRELVVLDGVDFLSLLEKIPVRTKFLRRMFQNVFEKAKNRVFELHFEDGDHQNMQKRKREEVAAGKCTFIFFHHKLSLCISRPTRFSASGVGATTEVGGIERPVVQYTTGDQGCSG